MHPLYFATVAVAVGSGAYPVVPAAGCSGRTVFVNAATGSDRNTGCTNGSSLLTLSAARAVARESHGAVGDDGNVMVVVVKVSPGVYELAETFELSGVQDSYTEWVADGEGAVPIVSAGKKLLPSEWTRSASPLPPGVFQLSLNETPGILGSLEPRGWATDYVWQTCGDYDIEFCIHHNNYPSALELFTAPLPPTAAATTATATSPSTFSFQPGTAQNLARYPNVDMHGRSAAPGSPYKPWLNASSQESAYQGGVYGDGDARGFRLGGSEMVKKIEQWSSSTSAPASTQPPSRYDHRQEGNTPWIHIGQQWMDAHCELAGFGGGKGDNKSSATVWATPSICTGHSSSLDSSEWGDDSRFYIYNLLSELDDEGEYFVDKKNGGTLYWKPPQPLPRPVSLSTAAHPQPLPPPPPPSSSSSSPPQPPLLQLPPDAFVSRLRTAISITNVTDVVLSGLAVLHARGNGIDALNATNLLISQCIVSNHGGLGINITNSTHSTVDSCSISETGDGGVWLEGGDRNNLIPSNLTLKNSKLREYNRWDRTYRPGVTMVGVGAKVQNNDFKDSPHQCIMVVGNDHEIETNTFVNNLFESSDSGVIYAETDWTFLGNVIRANNFSGVHSAYYPRMNYAKKIHPRSGGWWGDWVKAIHLDNQIGGFTVIGNTFTNYSYVFDINGGGQHVIRDNYFGPCDNMTCTAVLSLHSCGGAADPLPCPPLVNGTNYIVKWDLNRVPAWNSSLWQRRYPAFAEMIEKNMYCVPFKNVLENNVYDDVPCDVFPLSHDRAPENQLTLWNFISNNNSNTIRCGAAARRLN